MRKILISLCLLASCSTLPKISPEKAYQMASNDEAIIIDVREKDEIEQGMIDGAEWLPLSKIEKNDFSLNHKDKTLYLYCRTGKRAQKVKDILDRKGFKTQNLGGYETLKEILPTKISGKNEK